MAKLQKSQLAAFSRNVRRLREEAVLSQEELAEEAGLTPRQIQFLEAGRSACSVGTLLLLRRALDCSFEDLLQGLE